MVADHRRRRLFVHEEEVSERIAELIDRTERGQTIAIMREGQVVSELVPGTEPKHDPEKAKAAVERFLEERAQWAPTGITREEILAWRHEGHRW